MKPDVIVSWPHSCDYPLWRRFIADNRQRFAKVIVVFTTNAQGPWDYRPFVRANFPDVTFIDSPETGGRDWRDVAVNAGLDASDAEWVWFTEQDFETTREQFWRGLEGTREYDMYGIRDLLPRWHPACLFVRRSVVEQTPRYFGPEPNDHFVSFGTALDAATGRSRILWAHTYSHMQGLSQNHYLIDTGQTDGLFKVPEFHDYLRRCLSSGVPLDAGWAERAQKEIGMVTV